MLLLLFGCDADPCDPIAALPDRAVTLLRCPTGVELRAGLGDPPWSLPLPELVGGHYTLAADEDGVVITGAFAERGVRGTGAVYVPRPGLRPGVDECPAGLLPFRPNRLLVPTEATIDSQVRDGWTLPAGTITSRRDGDSVIDSVVSNGCSADWRRDAACAPVRTCSRAPLVPSPLQALPDRPASPGPITVVGEGQTTALASCADGSLCFTVDDLLVTAEVQCTRPDGSARRHALPEGWIPRQVACAADGDVLVGGTAGALVRWGTDGAFEVRKSGLRGLQAIYPASDGGYTLVGDGYVSKDDDGGPFVERYSRDDRLLWQVRPERSGGRFGALADGRVRYVSGSAEHPYTLLTVAPDGKVDTRPIQSITGRNYNVFADLSAVALGTALTVRLGANWLGIVHEVRPDKTAIDHTIYATLSDGRLEGARALDPPGRVWPTDSTEGPTPWIVGTRDGELGWFGQIQGGTLMKVTRVGASVTGVEALPDGRIAVLGYTFDRALPGDVTVPGAGKRAFLWIH